MNRLSTALGLVIAFAWQAHADIVVSIDNDDGSPGYREEGVWTTSGQTGYEGGTYRYRSGEDSPSTATWRPDLSVAGTYRVSIHFRDGTNRAPDAPWTIHHRTGIDRIPVDTTGPGTIREAVLGSFEFTTGTLGSVSLTNQGASGFVIADEVEFRMDTPDPPRFVWVTPATPVAQEGAPIRVLAEILSEDGVPSAWVAYRRPPGMEAVEIVAFDDGEHGDGLARDGVYGAEIPAQSGTAAVVFSFQAENEVGSASSEEKTVPLTGAGSIGTDIFILAGQSNASGRGVLDENNEAPDPRVYLFGNDYEWKVAYEPIDDPVGQVDEVSDDSIRINETLGHSLALRAGKGALWTSRTLGIIPCPRGGTRVSQWRRPPDPFDRSTLFGSMNFRRLLAAPNGVTAIWWYQGESDPGSATYRANHMGLVSEFREEMGAELPVVYVQLAKSTSLENSANFHRTSEYQRQMETGSGTAWELPGHFLVVAFDLPLGEPVHLNREGLIELGRRVALATREHVYGEAVDGTGPRLLRSAPLVHPGGDTSHILVRFDKPIAPPSNGYDGQFRVFVDDLEAPISEILRDPVNERNVLIRLADSPAGSVTLSYGDVVMPGFNVRLNDVVKGETGLPAPRFGPLPVEMPAYSGHQWLIR